jgi:hypothetical protein
MQTTVKQGIRLRDLRLFRERLRCGTSEVPPNLLGPEFYAALRELRSEPGGDLYTDLKDVEPEEILCAIDELIDERTRKR